MYRMDLQGQTQTTNIFLSHPFIVERGVVDVPARGLMVRESGCQGATCTFAAVPAVPGHTLCPLHLVVFSCDRCVGLGCTWSELDLTSGSLSAEHSLAAMLSP